MTDAEQRETARQFANKWKDRGDELKDSRSFWIDLMQNVLGIENVTDYAEFEKDVYINGHVKHIDVYVPEKRVLIEQKSFEKLLDVKYRNSDGEDLTAYEQAKRYDDHLNVDEKARWIITSNFSEIWIYDMNKVNAKDFSPVKIE